MQYRMRNNFFLEEIKEQASRASKVLINDCWSEAAMLSKCIFGNNANIKMKDTSLLKNLERDTIEINEALTAVAHELRSLRQDLSNKIFDLSNKIDVLNSTGARDTFDAVRFRSWIMTTFPKKIDAIVERLPLMKNLRYFNFSFVSLLIFISYPFFL